MRTEAAEILRTNVSKVLRLERKGLLHPTRDALGYRRYTYEELDRLAEETGRHSVASVPTEKLLRAIALMREGLPYLEIATRAEVHPAAVLDMMRTYPEDRDPARARDRAERAAREAEERAAAREEQRRAAERDAAWEHELAEIQERARVAKEESERKARELAAQRAAEHAERMEQLRARARAARDRMNGAPSPASADDPLRRLIETMHEALGNDGALAGERGAPPAAVSPAPPAAPAREAPPLSSAERMRANLAALHNARKRSPASPPPPVAGPRPTPATTMAVMLELLTLLQKSFADGANDGWGRTG